MQPNRVHTKDNIECKIYSLNIDINSNAIEVHIHNLRKKISDNIIKTVAGFLNAEGGTLLIGVSDEGQESYGIDMDVSLTSRGDVDGYELELNQLLMRSINKEVVAMKVRISFPLFKNKKICRVDVMKSYEAVFADTTKNKEVFFVRIGNSTNRLSPSSMVSYVQNHEWAELD